MPESRNPEPTSSGPSPDLTWRDGAPVSTRFDDPYFSRAGGLHEARHVFLSGNDLPRRLRQGFQVAELGFGTGLNLLAFAQIARETPVRFTSFEAFPLGTDDLARAHAAFPELAGLAAQLREGLAAGQQFQVGAVSVEVIPGDARETLPQWSGQADAWFLDGFAPARNPELWGPELMVEVARHTAEGGTVATYSAAAAVRSALALAGFDISRRPGFGIKRHMLLGSLRA